MAHTTGIRSALWLNYVKISSIFKKQLVICLICTVIDNQFLQQFAIALNRYRNNALCAGISSIVVFFQDCSAWVVWCTEKWFWSGTQCCASTWTWETSCASCSIGRSACCDTSLHVLLNFRNYHILLISFWALRTNCKDIMSGLKYPLYHLITAQLISILFNKSLVLHTTTIQHFFSFHFT